MATSARSSISPLRGLLAVTALVRAEEELPELLDAVARTIAESLGYRTVVINLYRPAWNDFCVTTVHGNDRARTLLLGQVRSVEQWESLLDDRFCRRGAYVVLAGEYDWESTGYSYVPDAAVSADTGAWHPEDALFLPMRHSDGHLLGVLSVDEPVSLRRPNDDDLDVLVSLADHAAIAVQSAQESAEAARHRVALQRLLDVSSRLPAEPAADDILRAVCVAVRDALDFRNVLATLHDARTGELEPRAAVGWTLEEIEESGRVRLEDVEGLLDPAFEIEGCYLLPREEAERRVLRDRLHYSSQQNGSGPWAWDHHWLLVPLHDRAETVIGILWADEPDDRLLPSAEKLQALRIFANQAAAAIVSSRHVNELRFLADHDPLTRLLNRRAFVNRLEAEVAGAARYDRAFGLVLCDLDGFKELNDRFGHPAGDEALQEFARTLSDALRKGDQAFRIGGDEFALLLAEADGSDAREVAGRVSGRLETVRASFGVASCPADARDAQTLFRLADQALYEAKRGGHGVQVVA